MAVKNPLFDELRQKYTAFYYDGFSISKSEKSIHISFDFRIENLSEFHPEISIETDNLELINAFDSPTGKKIIFNLGMVELVSYWKCACPPKIIIHCGTLDQEDILWWKKLYFNGLGEFFYRNQISTDFESFVEISATGEDFGTDAAYNTSNLNIIPVGGGKDSVVTLELLKELHAECRCFTVNSQLARTQTATAAGFEEYDIIKTHRKIDKELIRLNSLGYLNGHTPFSAIVAFLSLYCAYLIGGENIVLSNESSANEGNIAGTDINHQYSKSYEFECDFNSYIKKNIFSNIRYFSLLRAFNELQIAKQFSKYKHHHSAFKSCNAGSKSNIWCGNCPKCLFVYGILSPFLPKEELLGIFGFDLLNKVEFKNLFDGLVGFTPEKPFECVGTSQELRYALAKTVDHYRKKGISLPYLLEYFAQAVDVNEILQSNQLLSEFNDEHNIPQEFWKYLREMHAYVSGTD